MDVMKIANSLPMWIACGIAVTLVMVQAIIFALNSYKAGTKVGLTKKQMNSAIKSSAITSIGPSIILLQAVYEQIMTAQNAGNIGFENFVHFVLNSGDGDTGTLMYQANVQGISMSESYVYIVFRQKNEETSARALRRQYMEIFQKCFLSPESLWGLWCGCRYRKKNLRLCCTDMKNFCRMKKMQNSCGRLRFIWKII